MRTRLFDCACYSVGPGPKCARSVEKEPLRIIEFSVPAQLIVAIPTKIA